MIKIIIDEGKCLGCGTCIFLAPDNFELDEKSGKAKVKKQPASLSEEIRKAQKSCPAQAIQIQCQEK